MKRGSGDLIVAAGPERFQLADKNAGIDNRDPEHDVMLLQWQLAPGNKKQPENVSRSGALQKGKRSSSPTPTELEELLSPKVQEALKADSASEDEEPQAKVPKKKHGAVEHGTVDPGAVEHRSDDTASSSRKDESAEYRKKFESRQQPKHQQQPYVPRKYDHNRYWADRYKEELERRRKKDQFGQTRKEKDPDDSDEEHRSDDCDEEHEVVDPGAVEHISDDSDEEHRSDDRDEEHRSDDCDEDAARASPSELEVKPDELDLKTENEDDLKACGFALVDLFLNLFFKCFSSSFLVVPKVCVDLWLSCATTLIPSGCLSQMKITKCFLGNKCSTGAILISINERSECLGCCTLEDDGWLHLRSGPGRAPHGLAKVLHFQERSQARRNGGCCRAPPFRVCNEIQKPVGKCLG